MDFGTILHTAQKNDKFAKKEPIRCYRTKFEPPKKEQRSKQLSSNIKKFLAKREAEEAEKRRGEARKRDELLALRAKDKKSTRRVSVMLKRTKSASQSVLRDQGEAAGHPSAEQPDEDDYGYVSQEAAAFYDKMMEKYSQLPAESRFGLGQRRKAKAGDSLAKTKDRVRDALEREREEASGPHRRKRRVESVASPVEAEEEARIEVKKKRTRPPPPPSLNFNDLLKLAEKKQFEPVVIEPKVKEEERLLTKKQKKEFDRVKEWKERREIQPISLLGPEKEKGAKVVPKVEVKSKNPEPPKPGPSAHTFKTPAKPINRPSAVEQIKLEMEQRRKELTKMKEALAKAKGDLQTKPVKAEPSGEVRRKRPIMAKKGRILDSDEEYDSEMDDFIDDGPEEGENYSKYISEIFGYDKSKYRNLDDDVDNMESSFAQQMREEAISKKCGIMEDLEDMKNEEEEKRLKLLRKKKK